MSTETLRPERTSAGPLPEEFAPVALATRSGRVDVIHGVYAHSLPLAGLTVKQARAELEDRMNISPEAVAVIDGKEATEEEVLTEGRVLNFLTPAGEKG